MENCHHCGGRCIKKGFQKNGARRIKCVSCGKLQQCYYRSKACQPGVYLEVAKLLCIGSTRRGIARYLGISFHSVQKAILKRAKEIEPPCIPFHKTFEVDELRTYLGNKKRQMWLVTAVRKDTGEPVLFHVGRRTKKTLSRVTDSLLLAYPKKIFSDGLEIYRSIIPEWLHRVKEYQTNRVERLHLSLRTHLRPLARKTICYSKSLLMLAACVKVYYWG
jgi:insertion element IS1 protein InsB